MGCESNPCVDQGMEGALGRLSLVFFLGVGLPLVLQKSLFLEAKIERFWILLLIDSVFYMLGSKTLLIIYTAGIKNLDNEFEGFGKL